MKLILLCSLLVLANSLSAHQCPWGTDGWREDVEVVYNNALDVLYVRIMEGKIVGEEVLWKAEILKTFKGSKNGVAALTSSLNEGMYEGLMVGYSYIIYLFGSDEIDLCNYIIEVFPGVSADELEGHGLRPDILAGIGIRRTFELFNEKRRSRAESK